MEKVCPVCGAIFNTTNKRKIYCCENCGNKALVRKKKGKPIADNEQFIEKVCPVCKTTFTTLCSFKVYCSENCANRALKRKKLRRSISDENFKTEFKGLKVKRKCRWCGNPFEVHPNSRSIYCSEECRGKR